MHRRPGQAGGGSSIPSLATVFSVAYRVPRRACGALIFWAQLVAPTRRSQRMDLPGPAESLGME